jgi:hypothetical protein
MEKDFITPEELSELLPIVWNFKSLRGLRFEIYFAFRIIT